MTGIDGGGGDLVWPPRDLTSRLGVESPAKIIMSRPMWWMTYSRGRLVVMIVCIYWAHQHLMLVHNF